MARVNVYVPDELAAAVKAKLPELNVSSILQRGLQAALECRHRKLVCSECAFPVDERTLIDDALSKFFVDLWWSLSALIDRGGTAEGAARVAKDVAERHRITSARKLPLPRQSREQRKRSRVIDLPEAATA